MKHQQSKSVIKNSKVPFIISVILYINLYLAPILTVISHFGGIRALNFFVD